MELRYKTISEAWVAGLKLFREPDLACRHQSGRGICFDVSPLTLNIDEPSANSIPTEYRYPELIKDYEDRFYGRGRHMSLLHQRLRNWSSSPSSPSTMDQLSVIQHRLSRHIESRAGVFSLWRPDEDPFSEYPASPVAGVFRRRHDRLHLFIVARSVDYWIGAVPEAIVFSRLLEDVANDLQWPVGTLVYHMWSAHVYETDYVAYVR